MYRFLLSSFRDQLINLFIIAIIIYTRWGTYKLYFYPSPFHISNFQKNIMLQVYSR